MKKVINISAIFLLVFLFTSVNISCKKNQLQPTALWLKGEYLIFKTLDVVHQNNLKKIELARTTVGEFQWGDDVITINGPVAYQSLAAHAEEDFNIEYENSVLKDTTKLDVNGMMAQLIDAYLDKCQKYEAKKAYDKMYIAIPKDLYEVYPRGWERILTEIHWYLTGPIAGNYQDNTGTRLLWVEKYIRNMLNIPDEEFLDPWQQNLPFNVYLHEYYLKVADGTSKALHQDIIGDVESIRGDEAMLRFQINSPLYGGNVDLYTTHYDELNEVYYLEIPIKK